jgi:hypothetical protein
MNAPFESEPDIAPIDVINYTASDLAGIFPNEQPRPLSPLRLYEDEQGR